MESVQKYNRVFNVRFFRPSEYLLIRSWWTLRKMVPPELDMMPEESTFVLEVEGKPVASLSVIMTNTGTAWVDNFITDPESSFEARQLGMELGWQEVLRFVKKHGYVRLFAMSVNPRTMKRYEHFGFKKTLESVTTLVREV